MARSFERAEMNDTKNPALKKYQMANDVPPPKPPTPAKRKISPASAAKIRAKANQLLQP